VDPFLFAWKRTVDTLTVTGPLAWFRYRSSPESGWFHLFPIGFGQREGDRSGLGIFPFYYGREYGKEDVNYWTLGRFFFLWNSLGNERERHRSFLWKAMEHTSSGRDYDFRILHRLVVNRSVKGQREVAVGPFFRSFSDRESGARSFSLLSILYRSELRGGTETKRVFLIPVSVRKTGA
jgi:hypothetical protein